MARAEPTVTLVALGTSHLAAGVISFGPDKLVVRDFRIQLTEALRNGQVNDLAGAAADLGSILEGLGGRPARRHRSVHVLLTHPRLKLYSFGSSLYFRPDRRIITGSEIKRVEAQTGQVVTIPLSEQIVARYTQDYTVNDLSGIRNPLGLEAERLGVRQAFFTLPEALYGHLNKIFERHELMVESWYPRALASAWAVAGEEAMRTRVLLVAVGGTQTEYVGLEHYAVAYYENMPVGIEMIASLIEEAHGLRPRSAGPVIEEYAAFGPRMHGGEHIPVHRSESEETSFISSHDFNRHLDRGLDRLSTELVSGIQKAFRVFSEEAHVVLTGQGVAVGNLAERLEEKLGRRVSAGAFKLTHVESPKGFPVRLLPLIGRAQTLKETRDGREGQVRSKPVFSRICEGAVQWMRDSF